MQIYTPDSFSSAYMHSVSGAIVSQITQSSGVPQSALDATGQLIQAQIAAISGATVAQSFITQIPTGISLLSVNFPISYATTPKVQPTLAAALNILYLINPQAITPSGYILNFSDTVLETGVTVTSVVRL